MECLPCSEASSPEVTETAEGGSSRPKKRSQVRHACINCRSDKVKCSGVHPICTRCKARNLHCSYDVPLENMTKMQHLRGKIVEQEQRLILVSTAGKRRKVDEVNEIFDIFQKGTDSEAAEALARLRIGEKIEEVVKSMRERMGSTANQRDPDTTASV